MNRFLIALTLIIISSIICFFVVSQSGTPWEKRYDKSITFNKGEVIRRLNNLDLNFVNAENSIKPHGKFFAFKSFNDGAIGIDYDTDLHLEKVSLLACALDSITSFIFYHQDRLTIDAQYKSINGGNVEGYKEYGRIFFISPKNFNIEYVLNISGDKTPDHVRVKKFDRTTVSNGVGPLNIVNAISE